MKKLLGVKHPIKNLYRKAFMKKKYLPDLEGLDTIKPDMIKLDTIKPDTIKLDTFNTGSFNTGQKKARKFEYEHSGKKLAIAGTGLASIAGIGALVHKSKKKDSKMKKEALLEEVYTLSFQDELEKIAKNTPSELADAFYDSQMRVDKDRRSRGRKKLAIGVGGTTVLGGAGYIAHRKGLTGAVGKKLDNKVSSLAKKIGAKGGQYAGEVTNAAAESWKNKTAQGAGEFVDKLRGGNAVKKILKKILLKGK